MCVGVRMHVHALCTLAMVRFSVITGNIPQMTITHIKVVGEVKRAMVESLLPLNTVFSAR